MARVKALFIDREGFPGKQNIIFASSLGPFDMNLNQTNRQNREEFFLAVFNIMEGEEFIFPSYQRGERERRFLTVAMIKT